MRKRILFLLLIPPFLAICFFYFQYFSEPSAQMVEKRLQALRGKVAIITGSSSGIGYALAQEGAKHGLKLVLADKNLPPSAELAQKIKREGGEAFALQIDLKDPAARKKLVEETVRTYGGVGLLFNNAGYSYLAQTEQIELKEMQDLFEVNFFACVDLAKQVIPHMKTAGFGIIVNVSSILGHLPEIHGDRPTGLYVATKAALSAWSYKLHKEVEPFGIQVKVISPAGVDTNFAENSIGPAKGVFIKDRKQLSKWMDTAETIAQETFSALADDKLVTMPGRAGWIFKGSSLRNYVRTSVSNPL